MVSSVGDVFSKQLPSLIRVAQQRSHQLPAVHEIRQGPLLVSALLAFTSLQDVGGPIRFKRAKLAALLGVTTRTIDRRLGELERQGLAERVTPRGKVGGRWPVTQLRWGAVALAAFWPAGLPLPRGGKTAVSHSSSGESLGSRESGRAGPADRKAGRHPHDPLRRLPVDLQDFARRYGLLAAQVCTLMARCKARGQRLQDVLAVALPALPGRGPDETMRLLLHLTSLDRDYAAVRRHREQRDVRARTLARRSRREATLLAAVPVGAVLPGLGVVRDRGPDHVIVEQDGLRAVADARTVVRGLGMRAGWRGLLRVRRGSMLEPGADPGPGVPVETPRQPVAAPELSALARTLRRVRLAPAWMPG
jgi:hypothetical protein